MDSNVRTGSIPVRSTSIPLGRNSERDFCFCATSWHKQSISLQQRKIYDSQKDKRRICRGCDIPDDLSRPEKILFLNFNYTDWSDQYIPDDDSRFFINHIHGSLSNPESIIFGYGDELDKNYEGLKNLNNNEYLCNMKSTKYLEADNYRKLLSFIDSAPFQIYIMGHSCGNSDRTLLNTLFEHDNCVSIKPFFHRKDDGSDNYLDIVQNISRNFTDMKKMRDRVVNKTYCEPLPQLKKAVEDNK